MMRENTQMCCFYACARFVNLHFPRMKKIVSIAVLLLCFFGTKASHIVGGEFELLHMTDNFYRLNMILYFDQVNGTPGALDPSVTIRIFRKRDNFIVLNSETLSLASITDVAYTKLECSKGEVVTDRILYTSVITLLPSIYNDPDGYYIVWERCCRNYEITNIFSENPQVNIGTTRYAGQTFYLEFPPVVKNGEPFINNSPKLFPPLNDFACPYIPYYVDFAGVDDDGDSLAYSIVAPLNTKSSDALPPNGPRPAPYPVVQWKPGFGLNNIINGVTNLEISTDGFLTVTPKTQGLYVFAVRCEEFRDGVKIGEVRRDFQMLVVATGGCPDPINPPKPTIEGKGPGDASFTTNGKLSVNFAYTTPIQDRCFQVKISDPSTLKPDEGNTENVKIKAIALDFKQNISEILPGVKTAVIQNGADAFFQICFPDVCPYKPEGIFNIGIVASDDACALPLTDTLYVTVTIEPPPDSEPTTGSTGGLKEIEEILEEGDNAKTWPIQVTDVDGNILRYELQPIDFALEDVGMSFNLPLTGQQAGSINGELRWDPKCDVYDFTSKTDFQLYFIVYDETLCNPVIRDTISFDLSIDLPGNFDPTITNDLESEARVLEVTQKIYGEPISIQVTGSDQDTDDIIVLRSSGIGFSPSEFGATFTKKVGKESLQSVFEWALDCNTINLRAKDVFEFDLMVVDSTNKCGFYNADTLRLIVNVEPPDNQLPELIFENLNPDQPFVDGKYVLERPGPIDFKIIADDADITPRDRLRLDTVNLPLLLGKFAYQFERVEGTGPLETTFHWDPGCWVFVDDTYEVDVTFTFQLADNRCFNPLINELPITFKIKDPDGSDDDFLPPNIFTPNNDGKNEFFAMLRENELGELEEILPLDNCLGEFVSFIVFNRWGKQVFESVNRDFRWDGADMPAGVYYYYIKYTNKEYKGLITIMY
jgi:hypothetical protein